jgi:diguanylate cyclase (GGDEF)-like protein
LEAPLVDIVLLCLLVTFFGIQQRNRPQLYFRFWFAGWILVLCSFLAWGLRLLVPPQNPLRLAVQDDALFVGGIAFLLSFVTRPSREAKAIFLGLIVTLPACALIQLSRTASQPFWLLCGLVIVFEVALLHLIFTLVPRRCKRRRIALIVTCLVFVLLLITAARLDPRHLVHDWILTQLFFSNGMLYAASTRNRRSMEWFVGTAGFLAWGFVYAIPHLLRHSPELLDTVRQLWNLPKYAVGFAMTLHIFEGTRADVVRLADRYKDLYEDFRLLYENHPLPMWIYDSRTGDFLSTNAAATRTYGYASDEFLQMSVDQVNLANPPVNPAGNSPSPDDLPLDTGAGPAYKDALPEGALVAHRRKDGSTLEVELTEHNILFQGREARFVLAVDVTEREKLNQELSHRAQHDPLTGLPNRLLLDDRIAQSLLRSSREHKKAVLFTIDADRFKLINDTYGHLVGDEALKAIAQRLGTRIRSIDTMARTGGEEFTAIIGGLNTLEDAEKIAHMFVRLFDTPLSLSDHEIKVSISLGGAIYPDDGVDADTLRKKSDQALYHAKHLGRNRIAFTSHEVSASFDQAVAVEFALREALRNNWFELFYQPIFDSDGCALHFEALLRMKPETGSSYAPEVFIPVAEESNLIIPMGNWVIEEACRRLVEWRQLGNSEISIGVNVSVKQLLQKHFSRFILDTLKENDLPPTALQLELTESSLMAEPTLIREVMAELAKHGIGFAIDDFGTGYSSLARIADLPISQLKIDRSFIKQLDPQLEQVRRTDGIVSAIIHMGQTLNVQVVGEGVEDDSQLNLLLRRGCDLFQGMYLAPPLPTSAMSLAIEQQSPSLLAHPHFSHTRAAVSKRLRKSPQAQLPALAGPVDGAA